MQTQTNAVTRKSVYTRAKFIEDIKKLHPCDKGFDLLQATPGTPKQIIETYTKDRDTRDRYFAGKRLEPSDKVMRRAANLNWLYEQINYGGNDGGNVASARLTAFFNSVTK